MWYRLECDVGDDELWEELGARADVPGPMALGHYVAFTGKYGDRWIRGKIEGRLDALQDATIEKWAGWAGAPSVFAQAVRELCTDADSGELKGFRRRNEAILRKQLADAQKPSWKQRQRQAGADPDVADAREEGDDRADGIAHDPPREPPREPARGPATNPSKTPGVYDDGYNNRTTSSSSSGARDVVETEIDRVTYVQRCTVAANRALRENPQLEGFNELVASNQVEIAGPWYDAGIPIAIAEEAIYQRGLQYRPTAHNSQPRALTYWRNVVPEAAERARGLAQERATTPRSPARNSANGRHGRAVSIRRAT